jgi:hypothetical protein
MRRHTTRSSHSGSAVVPEVSNDTTSKTPDTPTKTWTVYSKSALLTGYAVVRIRDEIDTVLSPTWDQCSMCNTKLVPGLNVHTMTYDVPLQDNEKGVANVCGDCWESWLQNLERASSDRVIVPAEVMNTAKDLVQFVLDLAPSAANIVRDYPECPPLKVHYAGADNEWTYSISKTEERRAVLASYCIEMPLEVTPYVPLRVGTFTHDAFLGLFTHRDVFTLKVNRATNDIYVETAVKQWWQETMLSAFDTAPARENLLAAFGGRVRRIGDVINLSAFTHRYIDKEDGNRICYKLVLRTQLEPSVWDLMFSSFYSSFLDEDGDAQVINDDEMMWSQVFVAPHALPDTVQLRNGEEVPPGWHSKRMYQDRLSWWSNLSRRRALVLDTVAQFQRIALTPRAAGPDVRPNYAPEVLQHDRGWFVNIDAAVRQRDGEAEVTTWQYYVNAQRVSMFDSVTLTYIGTMDGKRLLCFRPDPRSTSSSTAYAYVPHFCASDPSTTIREMQIRGFLQDNGVEPRCIVDL